MSIRKLRYFVSGLALLFVVAHLMWPALSIDSVTAILLSLAVLPWVAPMVKSLEVPGVGRIELRGRGAEFPELNEVARQVEDVAAAIESASGSGVSGSRESSVAPEKLRAEFYRGARVGMNAVATGLEDLTIIVSVDGEEQRREVGRELAQNLRKAAALIKEETPR